MGVGRAYGKGYGKGYAMLECMKWSVVIYNFVFWLIGGTIFGIGIWLRADIYQGIYFRALNVTVYYVSAYLMITAGAIMMIMAFMGCLGSVRESMCLLKTYFCCMVVVFLIIVVAVFWTFLYGVKGSQLDGIVKTQLIYLTNNYSWNDWSRYLMDTVQEYMECCGIDNFNDYIVRNMEVPDSCRDQITGLQQYWGCYPQGIAWVEQKTLIAGTLTVVVALLQILGLVFTYCLISQVKKESEV
jgi:hypothetical protein